MESFRRQMLYLRAVVVMVVIVGSLVMRGWEAWKRTHEESAEEMREQVTGRRMRSMTEVFGRFALWYGAEPEPERVVWMVVTPNGRIEKSVKSPQEVLACFQKMPPERRAEGMFVTADLTHLEDPEGARRVMSAHMQRLFDDAEWMRAHERQVLALKEVCEAAGVALWVNADLGQGSEQVRFRRMTR